MLQLGATAEPGVTIGFTLASSSCRVKPGLQRKVWALPRQLFKRHLAYHLLK